MALFNRRRRTDEEQMLTRQSAPTPTADDYLNDQMRYAPDAMQRWANRTPLSEPIGAEQIANATQTLLKYKQGKANLDTRIVDNEEWYRLRNWECMRKAKNGKKGDIEPVSAWLFNVVANKHADMMDNYPIPNILPRESADQAEAKVLSSIVPVILEQTDFEGVYDAVGQYKLIAGTGVYGVYWDSKKNNGLGDIAIRKVDLVNLYYEPGITDIQESANVFYLELVDNDLLKSQYPNFNLNLGQSLVESPKYRLDDTIDTTNKSTVIDWYYKRTVGGNTILHYCKFVGNTVLFATENDPKHYPNGWYDHGEYPFVFDVLFPCEGSPCGFGYIDIGKDCQEFIDRGNRAIIKNMLANAKPRFFIRSDGAVKEEEYADTENDFVHVDGNLGADSVMPINGKTLDGVYVNVLQGKIDELKETTGTRDISTGGSVSGITAASAIAALQEAGSKLSRDNNKGTYRAFRKIVLMVIELIRQYYDATRCFRVLGDDGAMDFIEYNNAHLKPMEQGVEYDVDMGFRKPLFDITVSAQKASPYTKLSQNELALQFYQLGFFNPMNAPMALACLDMMDFDRKAIIMQKIANNGQMAMATPMAAPTAEANISNNTVAGGVGGVGEPKNVADAKARVAESTAP